MSTVDQIKQIFFSHYDVDLNDKAFTEDIDLFDYGYLDSFSAVGLRQELEVKFNFNFSQTDLISKSLNTINEIAKFIEEKIKKN